MILQKHDEAHVLVSRQRVSDKEKMPVFQALPCLLLGVPMQFASLEVVSQGLCALQLVARIVFAPKPFFTPGDANTLSLPLPFDLHVIVWRVSFSGHSLRAGRWELDLTGRARRVALCCSVLLGFILLLVGSSICPGLLRLLRLLLLPLFNLLRLANRRWNNSGRRCLVRTCGRRFLLLLIIPSFPFLRLPNRRWNDRGRRCLCRISGRLFRWYCGGSLALHSIFQAFLRHSHLF
mmetsp:Transcript_6791/g.16488  ORF Transcript_6791/g.16488 Transcript_6791/m.16488 type:complete len:235 (-) Transcript_6791:114-818(-)